MKARWLRDDIEVVGPIKPNPDSVHFVEKVKNKSVMQILCWKAGALIDGPKAFRLVQMGVAEPVDEECKKRANMTPQKMAAAIYAYERMNRGVHPDDFKRYDGGEMTGYNADGSDIPGPNAATFDDEDPEDEEDEE